MLDLKPPMMVASRLSGAIDLMSFGHWPCDCMASTLRGQPLITACRSSSPPSAWPSRATTTPTSTPWPPRDGTPARTCRVNCDAARSTDGDQARLSSSHKMWSRLACKEKRQPIGDQSRGPSSQARALQERLVSRLTTSVPNRRRRQAMRPYAAPTAPSVTCTTRNSPARWLTHVFNGLTCSNIPISVVRY